jgi:hypothetical protein
VHSWARFPGAGLPVIRAAAARVGGFSLLAVLVYVVDEDPSSVAGAGSFFVMIIRNVGERTPYNIGVHR